MFLEGIAKLWLALLTRVGEFGLNGGPWQNRRKNRLNLSFSTPSLNFQVALILIGCLVQCSLSAATFLYQRDFDHGTYLITKPGHYQLGEDIIFNPNSQKSMGTDAYDAGSLKKDQFFSKRGKYDDNNFGLGFFAAIVIAADGVTLDLGRHTIAQSPEHAPLQRFFAVIELTNQPFIPGQGPHNFGSRLRTARNIIIRNGTIGLSSHHGIHGNGNRNIRIENVHFKDFEIAAAALNGVDGLTIKDCTATSRKDLPVLGTFSAARFIKPYLDYLLQKKSKVTLNIGQHTTLTVQDVQDRLRKAVNAVHQDLIVDGKEKIDKSLHPEEYALFNNPSGVVDGNCYGFLVNAYGQAVEGFPINSRFKFGDLARNIRFENVHVNGLQGRVAEVVAIKHLDRSKAVVDPVGAIFQVKNVDMETGKPLTVSSLDDKEAYYTGNLLANAQAIVAKADHEGEFKNSGLDLTRLTITKKVIDWIESPPSDPSAKLAYLVPEQDDYFCNADAMFHVNKGVIAFKIDAANNVVMENTSAKRVVNFSEVGTDLCGRYRISHPKATLLGCGGSKTRGYSFAGSKNVRVNNSVVSGLYARCGSVVGFDILTDSSHITINRSLAENLEAGKDFVENEAPNEVPAAVRLA